jgi:hypothetical protein
LRAARFSPDAESTRAVELDVFILGFVSELLAVVSEDEGAKLKENLERSKRDGNFMMFLAHGQ